MTGKSAARRAIVVIDMQNDFVTGALGSAEAVKATRAIREALERNAAQDSPADIFFTQDTHGEDYLQTQEGRRLPVPHCIRGTPGWEIVPELRPFADPARTVCKPSFGSLELPGLLKGYSEVTLTGVCTDICVVSNALLLKAFLPEATVKAASALCAGTTPENHRSALSTMRSCQVEITEGIG